MIPAVRAGQDIILAVSASTLALMAEPILLSNNGDVLAGIEVGEGHRDLVGEGGGLCDLLAGVDALVFGGEAEVVLLAGSGVC